MEEKRVVFYVKNENQFQSVDVTLPAVRASTSNAMCQSIYADTVRMLLDSLQKLWSENENAKNFAEESGFGDFGFV
jgi:hypothetical protein